MRNIDALEVLLDHELAHRQSLGSRIADEQLTHEDGLQSVLFLCHHAHAVIFNAIVLFEAHVPRFSIDFDMHHFYVGLRVRLLNGLDVGIEHVRSF